jgi:hypothetical protein
MSTLSRPLLLSKETEVGFRETVLSCQKLATTASRRTPEMAANAFPPRQGRRTIASYASHGTQTKKKVYYKFN